MDVQEIKKLLKTPAGKQLHDFVMFHYNKIKNIEYLTSIGSSEEIALEVKSARRAMQILQDILVEIINIEEQPDKEEIEADTYQ